MCACASGGTGAPAAGPDAGSASQPGAREPAGGDGAWGNIEKCGSATHQRRQLIQHLRLQCVGGLGGEPRELPHESHGPQALATHVPAHAGLD